MTAPGYPYESSRTAAGPAALAEAVTANVAQVLRGKTDAVRLALTCLLAGGHLLIEDVPGTGKTSLAKGLAASFGGITHRIQFTPDLLPTDITGVSVWDQRRSAFEFRPGPVFAHVVVADEINRASPKTQSALLEVMEEAQVTVDGAAHPVPSPFLVVATQNPIDLEGTYRLPEAQLDRFLMRISSATPTSPSRRRSSPAGPAPRRRGSPPSPPPRRSSTRSGRWPRSTSRPRWPVTSPSSPTPPASTRRCGWASAPAAASP